MKADSPMHAIRLKCLDCMCEQAPEVNMCPVKKCPLWAYRFGKRPATAKMRGKDVDVCIEE